MLSLNGWHCDGPGRWEPSNTRPISTLFLPHPPSMFLKGAKCYRTETVENGIYGAQPSNEDGIYQHIQPNIIFLDFSNTQYVMVRVFLFREILITI